MQVAPHAEPFNAGDGPVSVLFCHGITGSPLSLREWAERTVAAGHRVAVPRLPGHGTTWQEANATDWRDWYACVDREFRTLAAESQQVFVAGLSMGGALALRLAAHHADQVAGLLLVNPAVLGKPEVGLAPLVSKLLPSVKAIGNDIAEPGVSEHAYERTPLKAVASMTRLWTDVRASLDLVVCPTLVFRSTQDHVVPASSTEYIRTHVSSDEVTVRVLERSYHVATMDYDKEQIFSESLAFIAAHPG